MALDENLKAFMAHICRLITKMTIYLAKKTKISLLLSEKVIIFAEYLDF